MSRIVKLTLAAAAAALMAAGAHAANGDATGKSAGKAKNGTEAISTSHKLLKTYFDTDNPSLALPSGTTTVGTTLTLNCGNAAGCTVAGNLNAQIGAAAAENAAAVCLVIDGGSVSCPYNAIVRAGSGFQVMSYQTFASVTPGNHTVDMWVFTSQPTTLYRWNKEIKLYKP